jgi:hypothetical protein
VIGRRNVGQQFRELFTVLAADYGGESCLSGLQRVTITDAARIILRARREKDPETQIRQLNCASRLLAGAQHKGMNPSAKPPAAPSKTLDEHLRELAQRQPGAVEDGAT